MISISKSDFIWLRYGYLKKFKMSTKYPSWILAILGSVILENPRLCFTFQFQANLTSIGSNMVILASWILPSRISAILDLCILENPTLCFTFKFQANLT